jgi:hypothetical protein
VSSPKSAILSFDSFNVQYLLASSRSSNSCLRLLPRLYCFERTYPGSRLLHVMRNSFPRQIYFVLPGSCSVNCTQTQQSFVSSKEENESQKHGSTADTRKLRGNATVRRLASSVARELSFLVFRAFHCSRVAVSSVCAAHFSSTRSNHSDNNSRKSRLRCRCQFPWCSLALIVSVDNSSSVAQKSSHKRATPHT